MNNALRTLLESFKRNYPLIHIFNPFNPVIAISTCHDDVKNVVETLTDDMDIIIPDSTGVPAMKSALKNVNSRGVYMIINDSRKISDKTHEKLMILQDIARLSRCDNQIIIAAVFIIFIGKIPDGLQDYILIRIDNKKEDIVNCITPNVIPTDGEIPVILNAFRRMENERITGLKMAAEFMNPAYRKIKDTSYEAIQDLLQMIEDTGEDNLAELFVGHILQLAQHGRFLGMCFELPKLTQTAENHLNNALFREGDKLFLSDNLFNELVADLKDYGTVAEFKEALRTAGVIRVSGSRNVVRMTYYDADGKLQRVWMLQFDINKIVSPDVRCKINYLI